jgi:hypothetical protein
MTEQTNVEAARGSGWRWLKAAGAIIVGVATVASLLVAWLTLQEQLRQIEAQTRRPPSFNRSLDSHAAVTEFVRFAEQNDYQVRRIDATCLNEGDQSCLWVPELTFEGDENDPKVLVLSDQRGCRLARDPNGPIDLDQVSCGKTWLHITVANPFDAQVDNGAYGAGNIVVHGYFAISLRPSLGSAPPDVKHVYLRAVAPELAVPR